MHELVCRACKSYQNCCKTGIFIPAALRCKRDKIAIAWLLSSSVFRIRECWWNWTNRNEFCIFWKRIHSTAPFRINPSWRQQPSPPGFWRKDAAWIKASCRLRFDHCASAVRAIEKSCIKIYRRRPQGFSWDRLQICFKGLRVLNPWHRSSVATLKDWSSLRVYLNFKFSFLAETTFTCQIFSLINWCQCLF